MNRRQRHERIIESWGTPGTISACGQVDWHIAATIRELGFNAFTDEAIEQIARRLVLARNLSKKINAENRRRFAMRAAS